MLPAMKIELKHLRVLDAIDRLGTISAAARELGYSQPAISQQAAQAERALKTPLLIRSRSGVRLTEAGAILARTSQVVLARVGQSLSEIDAIVGLRAGTIRLACFPSASAVLLPDTLRALRDQTPGITYSLAEREPAAAIEMLRAGECDIALIYEYASALTDQQPINLQPDERSFPVVKEAIQVALPIGHPLEHERLVDLRDLAGEVWIAGCSESRTHVQQILEAVGVSPKIAFETQNHVAIQKLVAAGMGVAMLPELVAAAGTGTAQVSLLPCAPNSFRIARAVTTTTLLSVPGVLPAIEALQATAEECLGDRAQ